MPGRALLSKWALAVTQNLFLLYQEKRGWDRGRTQHCTHKIEYYTWTTAADLKTQTLKESNWTQILCCNCCKQVGIWMPLQIWKFILLEKCQYIIIFIMKILVYITLGGRKSFFRSQGKHDICFSSVIWSLSPAFHVSSLPFPSSGLSPCSGQVMGVDEIREGLWPPLMLAEFSELPQCPPVLAALMLYEGGAVLKRSVLLHWNSLSSSPLDSQPCWSSLTSQTSRNEHIPSQSPQGKATAPTQPHGAVLKTMGAEQLIPHLLLLGTSLVGSSRSEYWLSVFGEEHHWGEQLHLSTVQQMQEPLPFLQVSSAKSIFSWHRSHW